MRWIQDLLPKNRNFVHRILLICRQFLQAQSWGGSWSLPIPQSTCSPLSATFRNCSSGDFERGTLKEHWRHWWVMQKDGGTGRNSITLAGVFHTDVQWEDALVCWKEIWWALKMNERDWQKDVRSSELFYSFWGTNSKTSSWSRKSIPRWTLTFSGVGRLPPHFSQQWLIWHTGSVHSGWNIDEETTGILFSLKYNGLVANQVLVWNTDTFKQNPPIHSLEQRCGNHRDLKIWIWNTLILVRFFLLKVCFISIIVLDSSFY